MFGKTSLISLVSALALAMPAVDAFATIGCYPAGVVTGLIPTVTGETTTGITSAALCAQRSRDLNRNYAYYDPSLQRCYSVLVNPLVGGLNNAVGTLVGGTGNNVCGATQLQGLDVTTPYTDFGCAAPIDTQTANRDTFISIGGILSVANCLDDCTDRGFQFAFVTNIAADLTCSCATNVNIVVPSLCGLGANYIYRNNLIAPSGIPARRRALEVRRNQKVGMCPSGLQACRVPSEFASDDFECVDVKAELESCGGCIAGIVDGDASLATSGVDCTALPGVEMGAVSCNSGKCEVSQCKRGYTLIDNTCTSTRSVASLALKALRLQNL